MALIERGLLPKLEKIAKGSDSCRDDMLKGRNDELVELAFLAVLSTYIYQLDRIIKGRDFQVPTEPTNVIILIFSSVADPDLSGSDICCSIQIFKSTLRPNTSYKMFFV